MAESSSQVDSDPAAVPPSSNPIKNGKRGAEEVVEHQVVGNKKHKTMEETNSGMETEENIAESSQAEVSPAINLAATTKDDEQRASISNECKEEDKDDRFKEDHQHVETPNRSVDSDPAVVPPSSNPIKNGKRGAEDVVEHQVVGNKKHKTMEETNSGMETEENIAESSQAEVSPAINLAATTQDDEQRASISNEYKEEDKDDRFKEDHQHVETPNRSALKVNNDLLLDHPTKLDERDEHHPTLDSGSKTLFLGNLSFSIEEDDVRDFFKNVGEIAEIRFAIKDDRFKGYGYIEFTTAEAAQEALKLNREVLLGRRVSLDFARRQRGAYTPGNSMDKPNQRGYNAQVKTVYVRGFESSDGYDNIWSTLEKHFGKCGEISRLCIPKDHVSGVPKGVAFIDFADSNGFGQALELDGSVVGGCRLTVEVAKRPKREGREGSGYGSSGWSGSGGGWSGSDGGWSTSDGGWRGSGGGWSESGGVRSGYGRGRSDSGGGWSRSGGGWVRESSYSKESGSGGGWRRENGYGSSSRVESGYGSRSNTKGGPDSRWHRESGYGGGWHRGSRSNDGGFSSSRVGSGGGGSSGNGYSRSSHRGREDSFSSGRYDSRRPSGP